MESELRFKVHCPICKKNFEPNQDMNIYHCPHCQSEIQTYKWWGT